MSKKDLTNIFPPPITLLLKMNKKVLNKSMNTFSTEDSMNLSGLGNLIIFIYVIAILSWIFYIYGIVKAFQCRDNKFLHVIASLFLFPLYHIYIMIAGC